MAHQLLGDRFATRNAPAWHGLGITFTEPLSATEATRLAGADIAYHRRPALAHGSDDSLLTIPDTYAIVREGLTPRAGEQLTEQQAREAVIGTCSADYEIIGNIELAAMLDPIAERYPVETVGLLGDGERIFYCLRGLESSDVSGDEIRNYFTVLDTKTPGHRAKVFYSPVRTVCQNTLTRGLASASITFDIRHTRGATLEMQFYTSLITQMVEEQEATLAAFRRMTQKHLSTDDTRAFIDAVFALPSEPARSKELAQHDYPSLIARNIPGASTKYASAQKARSQWNEHCARVRSYRATALGLVECFNDEHTRHAQTVWAAYNACTELSDWRNGRGAASSVLFGNRAEEKARAYHVALEHIGLN